MNRYSRQTILPEVGQHGQEKLHQSSVLCVGAGGLGSPALLYLAAAGVGKIGVIDPDTVSISNLQRQVLFHTEDEGKNKADTSAEKLRALNPRLDIHSYPIRLTEKNALSLFSQYDVVIDGSDNFSTKFLINDAGFIVNIPVVFGTVNQFEGRTALFNGHKGACYRCLYPAHPKSEIRNCAESGVLGSVAGTIGTLQATIALQYLISKDEPGHPLTPKFGKLSVQNFSGSWNFRSLQIQKNPNCPTCSKIASEVVLRFTEETCSVPNQISIAELKKLLNEQGSLLLIDVREEDEWKLGHIPGAHHWPLSSIQNNECPTTAMAFGSDNPIILYCASGIRSGKAAHLLKTNHSLKCMSLLGGLTQWDGELA